MVYSLDSVYAWYVVGITARKRGPPNHGFDSDRGVTNPPLIRRGFSFLASDGKCWNQTYRLWGGFVMKAARWVESQRPGVSR
jgi:hypothetical protein